MTLAERLSSFLVAPEAPGAPHLAGVTEPSDTPAASPTPPAVALAPLPAPAPLPPRLAVILGDASLPAALAGDVGALLAHRTRSRAHVVVHLVETDRPIGDRTRPAATGTDALGPAAAGRSAGGRTRAAAALAETVEQATGRSAGGSGREVTVSLGVDEDRALGAQVDALVAAAGVAPVIVALAGARPDALAPVLAKAGLVVAVLDSDAPATLPALVERSARAAAPHAALAVIARPSGPLPQALRHRSALRLVAEALDA